MTEAVAERVAVTSGIDKDRWMEGEDSKGCCVRSRVVLKESQEREKKRRKEKEKKKGTAVDLRVYEEW